MKTSIVVGLCYGDESKGATVSFLSKPNDLVVRFNGCHQAGHTVVKDGYRHVFSSFGAGTLNGAHTYWSEYCPFYPKAFYNERQVLLRNGFDPIHYIHPLSPITTPFDIDHNQQTEDINKHGSVGVGFGATVGRHENTPFKLHAIDLTYRHILLHKLNLIADYYKSDNREEKINDFLWYVDRNFLRIKTLSEIKNNYEHIIFEGAQGIMLDMDHGFFPNVTRSNTTSKNAMQIIKDNELPAPHVYYVMRSYLTRHGNGFMPNEDAELLFADETNITHKYQGAFRQGFHSLDQLTYAISCDCTYTGYFTCKKTLVVSCLDQTNHFVLLDTGLHSVPTFKNMLGHKFDDVILRSIDSEISLKNEYQRNHS